MFAIFFLKFFPLFSRIFLDRKNHGNSQCDWQLQRIRRIWFDEKDRNSRWKTTVDNPWISRPECVLRAVHVTFQSTNKWRYSFWSNGNHFQFEAASYQKFTLFLSFFNYHYDHQATHLILILITMRPSTVYLPFYKPFHLFFFWKHCVPKAIICLLIIFSILSAARFELKTTSNPD